jgi:multicomponent Na+:H+ antiporter subunit D
MIEWLHPGLLLIFGASLIPFLKGKVKEGYLVALPTSAFLLVIFLDPGRHGVFNFLGNELVTGRVDKMSLVFGYIFTLIATIGMIYSLHVKNNLEHIAALTYAGSALGVVFAGDLFTLFLFWEMMAFASVLLIWARKEAAAAGFRYLLVHIFGGVCLLAGIVIYAVEAKSILFDALPHTGWGGAFILLGFLVNAAVPPLHAWLPDAYPEATVTGTVFLSAFTTKAAVYVLARGFAGAELLVWLGVIMALVGIGYTIIENDIRRLLSYHIISQVGYMVAAVGIGSELAVNGAVAHAVNNILFKSLMFMGMGSILFITGRKKGTELGGLYRMMPLTLLLYMIGGFSISGVPLFNGFISKAMVISSAAEAHRGTVHLLLMMVAAGTFLSTTLKLPYVVFFGEDKELAAQDPPGNMLWGMALTAFFCVLFGVAPGLLLHFLPYPVEYHAYTPEHVVSQLQILLFTFLGFLLYLKKLHPEQTISLDADWFLRKAGQGFMDATNGPIAAYEAFVTEAYNNIVIQPMKRFVAACRRFDVGVIDGAVNAVGRGIFGGSGISNKIENYVVYGFINIVGYSNHLLARIFRRLQTGSVHNYAMVIIVGIFFLVNFYLMFREQFTALVMALR